MALPNLLAPTDWDNDPDELLKQYEAYIYALVREKMRRRTDITMDPTVFDLEVDEIAQRVLIKLWQALSRESIERPKAYIMTMVRNELNTMRRERKPTLPLSVDEEGELHLETMIITSQEGMEDPAN